MPDITLYNRTGQAVTYEGVEEIVTDTPDGEKTVKFSYGEVAEGTEIELDLAEGDQTVSVPAGYLVKEATIKKPETLVPEYIKKNVEIAGVVGEFAGDEMEKTVDLAMADGDQVIEADADTVLKKVTVRKPETLLPENIMENVDIGGVVGTLKDNVAGMIDGTILSVNNAVVSKVAAYAFYAKGVQTANLKNCKLIENSAFTNCSSLLEVSFPACLSFSGYSQFAFCYKLTEAVFPQCVSLGGGYTFARCSSLSYAEFPLLSSIPYWTFSSCSMLENVSFPECAYIASSAFVSCKALKSITFEKCSYVDASAFAYCTSLESVNLPNMKELNSTAFMGCTKLSQYLSYIYYVEDMAVYASSTFSGQTCTFRPGTRLLARYVCGYKSKMTGVSGLEDVKIIGQSAFTSCWSATFGEMPNVEYIGTYAFMYCSKLSEVNLPKCTHIGTQAFASCSMLSEVHANMASIVNYATFSMCINLKKVFLPNCSFVSESAFANCSSLETVIIGRHELLSSYAFAGCRMLVSLYLLGSSIGELKEYTFNTTPISGYSNYAGQYGNIYVRASLLETFMTTAPWETFSSRFIGMTDEEITALYEQEGYVE